MSVGAVAAAIATGSEAISQMANIGATAWMQGYGRDNEMEADRLGLESDGSDSFPRWLAAKVKRRFSRHVTRVARPSGGNSEYLMGRQNGLDASVRAGRIILTFIGDTPRESAPKRRARAVRPAPP